MRTAIAIWNVIELCTQRTCFCVCWNPERTSAFFRAMATASESVDMINCLCCSGLAFERVERYNVRPANAPSMAVLIWRTQPAAEFFREKNAESCWIFSSSSHNSSCSLIFSEYETPCRSTKLGCLMVTSGTSFVSITAWISCKGNASIASEQLGRVIKK